MFTVIGVKGNPREIYDAEATKVYEMLNYFIWRSFGILELQNRVTKPRYAKWRHTSS